MYPLFFAHYLTKVEKMLVAFLKSHEDRACNCEIVKFVDRLWIEKNGELVCIRSFIVHVKVDSPAPLSHVRMLVPLQELHSLQDLSETCLDDNYLFNKGVFSTGGFKLNSCEPDKKFGFVNYDYFLDVIVRTDSTLKSYLTDGSKKKSRIVSYDFPRTPINPGEFRLFRYSFSATSLLDEVFPRVFNLKIEYFNKDYHEDEFRVLDCANLEIKVAKLYNKETRQGGVDIFLHLPKDLSSTNFNSLTQTTSDFLPDGTFSKKKNQKFIWRARAIYQDEDYLSAGETPISIEGLINDPFEMEEVRGEITQLRTDTSKLDRDGRKNLLLGYIALAVGLVSLVLTLLFSNFIQDRIKTFCNAKANAPSSPGTAPPPPQ